MTARTRTILIVTALALASAPIYFYRLDDTPIYLTRDETFVGLSGYSIAEKARDLQGRFMPLYFYSRVHENWWAPALPYASALFQKVLPLSEATVRAPMAFAAVVNIVLVFFIGRLLFDRVGLAAAAAALLAINPAHVIENRFGNDSSLPVTFALAWMLGVMAHLRRDSAAALFLAGLSLGIGLYSYVGAAPLMPLYFALTFAVMAVRRDRWRRQAIFAAGFLLPIAAGIPWLLDHPTVLQTTFLHYQGEQFRNLDAARTMRLFTTARRAVEIARLYVEFWNPRFLFVEGAPTTLHSTGRVGVFLVSVAGLLLVGAIRCIVRARSAHDRSLLLVGAFLLTPAPASLVDFSDHTALHAMWRAVEVVAFGALLAVAGVEYIASPSRSRWQGIALVVAVGAPVALLVGYRSNVPDAALLLTALGAVTVAGGLVLLLWRRTHATTAFAVAATVALAAVSVQQFAGFYVDYLTKYRGEFVVHTDGPIRELITAIVERVPPVELSKQREAPAVYVGFRLGVGDWGNYYLQFYLHKYHREDLLPRTTNDINASQFSNDRICRMPPGSIAATRIGWDPNADAVVERMIKASEVTLETLIRDPFGQPMYWVLRTAGACVTE
jgi:4-amino-4-deoxy-L-arabinose transferase-like glycosyltransferase